MSTYQLRTFADIVATVREELQIQSTDTTAINRIKRDINIILEEVIAKKRWFWLCGSVDLTLPAYVNSGSVSVTQNSNVATLTVAPMSSKTGFYFGLDGYNEIYRIDSHTAGTLTLKLQTAFTGATVAGVGYKIWTDRIPLPTDCKETSEAWHDTYRQPLENVGRQEFRRIVSLQSRNEGAPLYYYTGDYIDPSNTSTIASLPLVSTRASAGTVKTIQFSTSLPAPLVASVTNGDPVRWRVTNAGEASYNGDIVIAGISTTSNANDTVTYIGKMAYTESAVADSNISFVELDQEVDYRRYREIFFYPYLNSQNLTVHIDYYKDISPLNNESDEPLIPIEDRVVLVYGALERAWSRIRNPPEAARNSAKYEQKIKQMESKWQDSTESARLLPSKNYLGAKRNQWRKRGVDSDFGPLTAGGGSGGQQATGTANSAAQFGIDGVLVASPKVSTTELGYLDGATSNIQTQINLKAPTDSPIFTGTVTAPQFSGPLSGAVTGNLTGNVTGNVSGSSGSCTGNSATVTTNANLTGDVTSVGNATTLTNAPVIAKVLTGYSSGAGTVAATDSILQAIQKLNGNDATNANLTGPITSTGNATAVAAQTGTGSTFVMQASPTLTTPNLGTPSTLVGTNISGTAASLTAGTVTTNANLTGDVTSTGNATSYTNAVPAGKGGTAATASSSTPAASANVLWDANKNLSGNNLIEGYRTQAAANSTLALVIGDAGTQAFTGSTSGQVVTLPTTSVIAGMAWSIINASSQVVTLQASGGGTIQAMGVNTQVIATANAATPTTAAGWNWSYQALQNALAGGGTVSSVTFTGDGTVLSSTPSSAVTTTGTVTAALATAAKQTYLGGPTSGAAASPTYRTFTPPTIQQFSVTGSTTGYLFVITTTSTCAVGDTYTNNGHTYTVLGALSAQSGSVLFTSQASAPAGSGNLLRATGSGTSTIAFTSSIGLGTYTTPTSPAPLYLKVKVLGDGGGGGSSGTAGGTSAANGVGSYFGANLITAAPGLKGSWASRGGLGGSFSVAVGATQVLGVAGGNGSSLGSNVTLNATGLMGGPGGNSAFGGGGGGGAGTTTTGTESAAASNTGAGGGGGGSGQQANNDTGSGGGAGGYVEAIISTSIAATYPFAVGGGGSGAGAGTNGATGGNGANGLVIIEEYYQ